MKKILSLVVALTMIFAMATTAFAATDEGMATDNEDVYVSGKKEITITNTANDGNSDISSDDNTWQIGVEADLDTSKASKDKAAKVYYVVVQWEIESSLVYTLNDTAYSWNVYADKEGKDPATSGVAQSAGYELDYTDGYWTGAAKINVSITNWSNGAVTYTVSFAPSEVKIDDNGNITGKVVENIDFNGTVSILNAEDTLDPATDGTYDEVTGLYTAAATNVATVDINEQNVNGMDGAIKDNDALIGIITVKLNPVTTNP